MQLVLRTPTKPRKRNDRLKLLIMDFKPIVKASYPFIIKGTVNRILLFEIDSIVNTIVRLHIEKPSEADEKLIMPDKFYLYREIWKAILEILYAEFLPHKAYTFDWKIEVSPYTLMLCNFTS